MQFNVLTLFPDFFKVPLHQGVVGQACQKNIIQCNLIQVRDFSQNEYQSVDDKPFGGGEGMVLSYTPLEKALLSLKNRGRVVYLSPQGRSWNHKKAKDYAQYKTVTLVCGRYSGVDARWLDQYVDEEISVGDYILSGGELAALILIDSISRFLKGVLGHPESASEDTFEQDFLLKYPQWTRPQDIKGYKIPDVFLSGHHENIKKAQLYLSLLRTQKNRPDLLEKSQLKSKIDEAQKWYDGLSLEEKQACFIEKL